MRESYTADRQVSREGGFYIVFIDMTPFDCRSAFARLPAVSLFIYLLSRAPACDFSGFGSRRAPLPRAPFLAPELPGRLGHVARLCLALGFAGQFRASVSAPT